MVKPVVLIVIIAAVAVMAVRLPKQHHSRPRAMHHSSFVQTSRLASAARMKVVAQAHAGLEAVRIARENTPASWWGLPASPFAMDRENGYFGSQTDTATEHLHTTPNFEVDPAITRAVQRLNEQGTTDHDLDPARFRELLRVDTKAESQSGAGDEHSQVIHDAQAAVSAQLELQKARVASAKARAFRVGVGATTAAVCAGIVAQIRVYHLAHAAFGTALQIGPLVLVAVATTTQAQFDLLFPIVNYRAANRGGWANACTAAPLAADVAAHTESVAAGHRIQEFSMGLEEEYNNIQLDPDTANVGGLITSAVVSVVRNVPWLKVCPDHKTAPTGFGAHSMPVLEMATGPMPMTAASRTLHRSVVERFEAELRAVAPPASGLTNIAGATRTLAQVQTLFNTGLPVPLANFQLTTLRGDHATFDVRIRNNLQAAAYNSIQVNFECGLCAIAHGDEFIDLHTHAGGVGNGLAVAFRAAAEAILTDGTVAGLDANEIGRLSAHQRCELKGLFTVWVGHLIHWGFRAKAIVADRLRQARTAAHALDATVVIPPVYTRHYGGHYKNFFELMVKTSVHDIVTLLPYQLSDIVANFYAHYNAAGAGPKILIRTALATIMKAALTASAVAGVRAYGGNEATTGAAYLEADGSFITFTDDPGTDPATDRMQSLKHPAFGGGAIWSSPIYDRGPPAYIYRANAHLDQPQVVVVVEARYQTELLNRAMTIGMIPVAPLVANALNLAAAVQGRIDGLIAGSSANRWAGAGEQAHLPPVPV